MSQKFLWNILTGWKDTSQRLATVPIFNAEKDGQPPNANIIILSFAWAVSTRFEKIELFVLKLVEWN